MSDNKKKQFLSVTKYPVPREIMYSSKQFYLENLRFLFRAVTSEICASREVVEYLTGYIM